VDAVHPHLLESGSEFTVVACIGAQGAGKSTILSLLLASFRGLLGSQSSGGRGEGTGSSETKPEGLAQIGLGGSSSVHDAEGVADIKPPLDIHSTTAFLEGQASPAGIDLCVSALDRLLLLDAQPLFNYEYNSDVEMKSELYLLLFLTSICHTLLVVVDSAVDLQLWKFLRLLATLKAKTPDLATWVERQGDRCARPEHFPLREVLPRIVVVFNNLGRIFHDETLFKPVTTFVEHSLWKKAPSFKCIQVPTLPGSTIGAMLSSDEAYHHGMRLRECVLCSGSERGKFGREGLQLTEREWLYHASGYWDFVQKVSIVQEYFDIIAQSLDTYGWPKF